MDYSGKKNTPDILVIIKLFKKPCLFENVHNMSPMYGQDWTLVARRRGQRGAGRLFRGRISLHRASFQGVYFTIRRQGYKTVIQKSIDKIISLFSMEYVLARDSGNCQIERYFFTPSSSDFLEDELTRNKIKDLHRFPHSKSKKKIKRKFLLSLLHPSSCY